MQDIVTESGGKYNISWVLEYQKFVFHGCDFTAVWSALFGNRLHLFCCLSHFWHDPLTVLPKLFGWCYPQNNQDNSVPADWLLHPFVFLLIWKFLVKGLSLFILHICKSSHTHWGAAREQHLGKGKKYCTWILYFQLTFINNCRQCPGNLHGVLVRGYRNISRNNWCKYSFVIHGSLIDFLYISCFIKSTWNGC